MLEWSVESWSEYIDNMEETLRADSVEAKVAPVATVTSPVNLAQSFHRKGSGLSPRGPSRGGLSRQGTMQTTAPRPGTTSRGSQHDSLREEPSEPSTPPSPASPTRIMRRTLSGFSTRVASRTLSGFLRRGSSGLESGATRDRFSFNELQGLSLTGDETDRSILALEQSRDVVTQVQEQYETVVSSHAFTTLLDGERCKAEVATFFRRVRSILHDMGVHHRRLQDLSRIVGNDKHMFESLSQHTSIQTSKAFQLVAQTSSNEMMQWTLKMHEIAVKTKQETL
ncbi:hypothetical protein C8A00DRAFT_38936 [Chaetomidium leptoderma]|uniref:Uncharacterized protein n=1 Tax=Chaetomidium leptoderma TaxID=669021 RepID=A0AAN6VE71_9PEZI|nr:hypothetical protein C8A00DRAFT_38936 [Chaetomidium leptoderma]